jgi:hypothetical protein
MGIRTEDGVTLEAGDRAYNYYDRKSGRIMNEPGDEGWFDFQEVDGTIRSLNGERICSLEYAQSRGWLGPEDCDFDYKTWTPDGTYCRTCKRSHLGV